MRKYGHQRPFFRRYSYLFRSKTKKTANLIVLIYFNFHNTMSASALQPYRLLFDIVAKFENYVSLI